MLIQLHDPERLGKLKFRPKSKLGKKLKKSAQNIKRKIKSLPPAGKIVAAALLGPIAPTISAGIVSKTVSDKAIKKSPKLRRTIERIKKLPPGKKAALLITGGILAPVAPIVASVAIPTAIPLAKSLAVIKTARTLKNRGRARGTARPSDNVTEEQKGSIPVSARTDQGNVSVVEDIAEGKMPEEKKIDTGSALKWIAPLAAIPFFLGNR